MWQLLNFIVGEAKMAIYLSRKNKIEDKDGTDAIVLWRRNVRFRLQLEFSFFKTMNDFKSFTTIWCYKNVICTILNDDLYFSSVFKEYFFFFPLAYFLWYFS